MKRTYFSPRDLSRPLFLALFLGASAFAGCAASESGVPTGDFGDDDDQGGTGNAPAEGGTDSGGSSTGGTNSGGTASGTGGSSGGGAGTSSGGSGAGGSSGTAGTAGTVTGGTSGTGPTGGTGPSGTPSIPLPYSDDFETSQAVDWRTITFNSWAVTDDGGNSVYQIVNAMSDEEDAWAVGGDRNWTNIRLEARLKFVSGSDGMIYLAARFSRSPSDYNYYWVEFPAEGKLKVRRRTNGSSADIVTTEDEIVAGTGTWHTVAVTLSGPNVTLEYDGTVVGTGTDTAPLERGGIAIAATDSIVAIDDVSVTEAP